MDCEVVLSDQQLLWSETGSIEDRKRSRPKTVSTYANKANLQNELASSQEKDKS